VIHHRYYALLLVVCLGGFVRAETLAIDELEGRPITRVTLEGSRVSRAALEPRIAFREGQPFRREDADRTRSALHDMRLFKSVDIDAHPDGGSGGVEVAIKAVDGWFLLPIPLLAGGGGGGRATLILVERNFFRRAESILATATFNEDGHRLSAGGSVDRLSLNASVQRRDFTERAYADGLYNASGYFRSSDEEDPLRFGPIRASYEKEERGGSMTGGWVLSRQVRTTMGATWTRIGYPLDGVVPSDAGRQNALELGISAGTARSLDEFTEIFGAIFGLGMADMDERLKPLVRRRTMFGADFSLTQGSGFVGSDFSYTRLSGGFTARTEFPNRHRVTARLAGARGWNLPFSQRVTADRRLGLRGNYAREPRGETGIGASVSLALSLRRTRSGAWTSEFFGEEARVWENGTIFRRPGVGAALHYRFWRFPLPLGVGYTYDLKDRETQATFAIGGMF